MSSKTGTSTSWMPKLGWGDKDEKSFPVFQGAKDDDLVILVMGPTGVGKSTFIREYTGNKDVEVGHKLKSCTRDVTWYLAELPNLRTFHHLRKRRLVLVDTPGFDDTFDDDSEILKRVSSWLARSYNEDKTLAGIIYFNDISQKRMFGSTRTNFKMFQKLCGHDSFKKVVLATSQWDTLPELRPGEPDFAIGRKREGELRETFWKDVLHEGATLMSIQRKPEDQRAIIEHLISSYIKAKDDEWNHIVLQIQTEIVDIGKNLPATEAGQELKYTLEGLIKLQEAAKKTALDEKQREEIEQKRKALKVQLKAVKLSWGDRIKKFLGLGKKE